MSSAYSSFSQIGPRIGYFIGISQDISYNIITTFNLIEGKEANATMTQAEFEAAFGQGSSSAPSGLFKDMGKTVTLIGDNGLHVATFRKVQIVNGPDSEGVPSDYGITYVCTWSADPNTYTVQVVRTG